MTARTMPMLRALADRPGGLSTVDLARACDAPVHRCSTLMSIQERSGRVARERTPRAGRGRLADRWRITGAGQRYLEEGGASQACRAIPPRPWPPAGYFALTEKCFLMLGIYSTDGEGTTRQVREWLAIEGEQYTGHQVKEALRSLSRMREPLVEQARRGGGYHAPSLWRHTEYGRALLAED